MMIKHQLRQREVSSKRLVAGTMRRREIGVMNHTRYENPMLAKRCGHPVNDILSVWKK
jgi:hypothetical protein